jgi:hypothetical protein
MRAALTALLAAAWPALATAAVPVVLAERQVLTLEFAQPVQRLAVSDTEAIGLKASGSAVKVQGLRAGRVQLDVIFTDGATASFDVRVEPLKRTAARPLAPDELELAVGQERVVPSAAGSQALLEDNGVARAEQDGRGVRVRGLTPGTTTLVVVDPSGGRTTWKLRVR